MDESRFREICLSMDNIHEEPHWDKTSFRYKKKILATYEKQSGMACLKLTPAQQDLFCLFDPAAVFPVPNAWGKKGYTYFVLARVPNETLEDALRQAYDNL